MEASGSTRQCHFIGGTWKHVAALDISSTRHCHFIIGTGGTWKQVAAQDIVISLDGHGSKWQHETLSYHWRDMEASGSTRHCHFIGFYSIHSSYHVLVFPLPADLFLSHPATCTRARVVFFFVARQ